MHIPRETTEFAPLLSTLKQVRLWLDSAYPPPIVLAKPTVEGFKDQNLPPHCSVTQRTIRGPRRALRGRRHHVEPKLHLAHWPYDGLVESSIPSMGYVVSGTVDFNVADYTLYCRAGDFVVFPAGVPKTDGSRSHFADNPSGRFGEVLWLHTGAVSNEGLSCWVCRSEGTIHTKPPHTQCRVEHRLLAQLFNGFCRELAERRRLPIAHKLLSLIFHLLHDEIEAGSALKNWGRPRYRGNVEKATPITNALIFIEEYLDEHLTIERVAREVFLSPSTFTRLFRQETGQTFQEYQTSLRLKVAEELLSTTHLPVIHICKRVGLKYDRLRQLFQERHGYPPSRFRELNN